MKPMTVAFLADYYASWMGGANLLAYLLDCTRAAAARQDARIELLMDARGLPDALQQRADPILALPTAGLQATGGLQCLLEESSIERIVFYRDLPQACQALGVDVIGPTGTDLGADFPVPWFAYVPDFQHQYLAHFFSQSERSARDRHFRSLIENACGVFVNSGTVAADIERFYPAPSRATRVLRLPALLPDLTDVADADATARKHGLERPFFLSCSQRWLHKQHPLILEAFADLVSMNPHLPIELVFTGDTVDHRDPQHAQRVDALIARLGLGDRVRVLGRVPRAEQLALIRLSMAVVQASLFEGGPGASGTLEATLLGTPAIASDIGPNRELPVGRMHFFDARSAAALSEQMGRVVAEVAGAPDGGRPGAPFDRQSIELLGVASGLQLLGALRCAVR